MNQENTVRQPNTPNILFSPFSSSSSGTAPRPAAICCPHAPPFPGMPAPFSPDLQHRPRDHSRQLLHTPESPSRPALSPCPCTIACHRIIMSFSLDVFLPPPTLPQLTSHNTPPTHGHDSPANPPLHTPVSLSKFLLACLQARSHTWSPAEAQLLSGNEICVVDWWPLLKERKGSEGDRGRGTEGKGRRETVG